LQRKLTRAVLFCFIDTVLSCIIVVLVLDRSFSKKKLCFFS